MRNYLFTLFLALTTQLISLTPVIILAGPPGSGKGTFSQHLKTCYHYNHISSGDLVRQEIFKRSPIGLAIEDIVKNGDFILQTTMHALLAPAITESISTGKPLIIDGFVRSEEDSQFLNDLLSKLGVLDVTFGIFFEADDLVCQERILNRQICTDCAQVYNTQTAPPRTAGICDLCTAPLSARINDTPAVISKRIREFRERIGDCQMSNIESYPHLILSTLCSLEECLQNYAQLAEKCEPFDGNARAFTQYWTKENCQ